VTLLPEKASALQAVVGTMIELKYLKADEVARIPRRVPPMEVAAYAPIGRESFDPDLVVFRGNAHQIILISEAARAAGACRTVRRELLMRRRTALLQIRAVMSAQIPQCRLAA
jgi:hypothetical protein